MWPFSKKSSQALPPVLYFKNGQAFFEYQCKYGHTDLKENHGVVAIVLDAQKESGTSTSVAVREDGVQMAMIRVASADGGFKVFASTLSEKGEPLKPDDVVVWVPSVYNADIAKGLGDDRAGWVGFIRAKIAPEISTTDSNLRVVCEYN